MKERFFIRFHTVADDSDIKQPRRYILLHTGIIM